MSDDGWHVPSRLGRRSRRTTRRIEAVARRRDLRSRASGFDARQRGGIEKPSTASSPCRVLTRPERAAL